MPRDQLLAAAEEIETRTGARTLPLTGFRSESVVTFILEKKFLYAAIASAVGAVLSFIGLIHAPEVAWVAGH